MNSSNYNHDSFFKDVFGEPEQAAGLLRFALPPEVLSSLDLAGIRRLPEEHTANLGAEGRADLLYEVPCIGGAPVIISIFEHKSTPDRIAVPPSMHTKHLISNTLQENTRAARWAENGQAACEREGSGARKSADAVANATARIDDAAQDLRSRKMRPDEAQWAELAIFIEQGQRIQSPRGGSHGPPTRS